MLVKLERLKLLIPFPFHNHNFTMFFGFVSLVPPYRGGARFQYCVQGSTGLKCISIVEQLCQLLHRQYILRTRDWKLLQNYIVTMCIPTSASVAKINGNIYKRALFHSERAFIIMGTNGTLLGLFVCSFKSLWPIESWYIQQKRKCLINETVDEKFHEYVGALLMKF